MSKLEHYLVEAAIARLRAYGLKVTWQSTGGDVHNPVDGDLRVKWDGGHHVFRGVVKGRLSPYWVPLLKDGGAELVVTDYVSPNLSEALSDAGLSYADASGNASLTAAGLLVRVEGRRPVSGSSISPALPFSTTGLPVTFALLVLASREERPTQRELSALTESSLGSTNRVVQTLRQLGYLSEDGVLLKRKQLVERWTEAYLALSDELSPARSYSSDRWASPRDVPPSLVDGAYMGSELAAAYIYGMSIRPETALIYAWSKTRQELVRAARLRPAEDGWVRIREPFWQPDLLGASRELPDFLVRADLLAEGDPRLTSLAMMLSTESTKRWPRRATD